LFRRVLARSFTLAATEIGKAGMSASWPTMGRYIVDETNARKATF